MTRKRFAAGAAIGVMAVFGLMACGDDDKPRKRPLSADGGGSATGEDDEQGEGPGDGLRTLDGGAIDEADGADAAVDAAPEVRCDLMHPQLGCGVTQGEWVSFPEGLDVDRRTGFAWKSVPLGKDAAGNVETDDALELKCKALEVPGVVGFRIPQMEDVRTLAAGCAKTLPTGPCKIKTGANPASSGADCGCGLPVRGPHPSGGFCRPELGTCETLWTATHCGNHSIGCVADADHKHWFYDVKTGSIVVAGYDTEIARSAKGRCVSLKQVELP